MYKRETHADDGEAKHACDQLNQYKDKPSVKQLQKSEYLLSLNTKKPNIFCAEYTTAANLYKKCNFV